ncbi:hypothetical protein TNCV_4544661 [Trichonephila clavipes]|nr:hypothetical protein TNCV_4544661 [Trichonephila clavipes]
MYGLTIRVNQEKLLDEVGVVSFEGIDGRDFDDDVTDTEDVDGSLPIPTGVFCVAKGYFDDISLFGKESNKNLALVKIWSMLRLGKTRPLAGPSSIGSISRRIQLRSGMPPSTTESNKGKSMPVIWQ